VRCRKARGCLRELEPDGGRCLTDDGSQRLEYRTGLDTVHAGPLLALPNLWRRHLACSLEEYRRWV
jgi:hypothetical protein